MNPKMQFLFLHRLGTIKIPLFLLMVTPYIILAACFLPQESFQVHFPSFDGKCDAEAGLVNKYATVSSGTGSFRIGKSMAFLEYSHVINLELASSKISDLSLSHCPR